MDVQSMRVRGASADELWRRQRERREKRRRRERGRGAALGRGRSHWQPTVARDGGGNEPLVLGELNGTVLSTGRRTAIQQLVLEGGNKRELGLGNREAAGARDCVGKQKPRRGPGEERRVGVKGLGGKKDALAIGGAGGDTVGGGAVPEDRNNVVRVAWVCVS